MKILNAAKIKEIAVELTSRVMLAAMARLCIRFFMTYLAPSAKFYTMTATISFSCTYARKRIVNRINHERKFALFTKNPNSRAGLFGLR